MSQRLANSDLYDAGLIDNRNARPLTIAFATRSGVSVLYVTHRLDEIFEIGDRVSVLRDGLLTRTAKIGEITRDEVVTELLSHAERLRPVHARGRRIQAHFGRRRAAGRSRTGQRSDACHYCRCQVGCQSQVIIRFGDQISVRL